MGLTLREKAVAITANGIAVYSLLQERGDLPDGTTMYDFVLRVVPDELRQKITADLVDEVFVYVSTAHGS